MSWDLGIKCEQSTNENNSCQNSSITAWNLCNQTLLPELNDIIVKELNRVDVPGFLVSKEWFHLSKKHFLELKKKIAFGAEEWAELGVAVKEPPLPSNLLEILERQCPFSETGVRIKDSHSLVLLPGDLNGKPVGFRNLGDIVKEKFPQLGEDGYTYLKRHAETTDGIRNTRWVLIKKRGFAKGKSFDEQVRSVRETGGGEYIVPRAVDTLACAIAVLTRSKVNILKNGSDVVRGVESENGSKVIMSGKKGFFVSNYDWADDEDATVLPMMELNPHT